jgi:hypothetical protein
MQPSVPAHRGLKTGPADLPRLTAATHAQEMLKKFLTE